MITPFTILQDEWVMLAPVGDHPHPLGIQRFTSAAIQNVANRFNGFLAKLGRLFSGAPTFEGHHDIEPQLYPNSKSFGWIMALEARADGLWGRMTWTPEGREMLQNGAFKFVSPVFIGNPIGQENGKTIYDPIMFKSLALTNQPNLPLPPLANTKSATETSHSPLFTLVNDNVGRLNRGGVGNAQSLALTNQPNLPLPPLANEKDHMQTITEILQLQPEATAEQIIEAARALHGRVTTLQNSVSTGETALTNAQTQLANAIARADAAQTRLVGMILDNAVRENRITLAQRDHWKAELEKDLAAAEAQLAKQQPALNTTSVTRELGNEKGAYDTEATRRAALIGYIAEQQAKGLTYDEAWAKAKIDRADIFANMVRK